MAENDTKIILGIDPGSQRTGFGFIEIRGDRIKHLSHGVIVLTEEPSFSARLLALGESLRLLMEKRRPDMICIEKIFLGKSPQSAFQLGHARGVVIAESARTGAEIHEYATRAVKKGITGNGGASKEDVQTALQKLLGLVKLVNLDASDALALAVYQSQRALVAKRESRLK